MRAKDIDFTGKLGQLFTNNTLTGQPHEWPMYSFDRVSFMFWNAFANTLLRSGLSESQVLERLQHRDMRHMLDTDEEIELLGQKMAARYANDGI